MAFVKRYCAMGKLAIWIHPHNNIIQESSNKKQKWLCILKGQLYPLPLSVLTVHLKSQNNLTKTFLRVFLNNAYCLTKLCDQLGQSKCVQGNELT